MLVGIQRTENITLTATASLPNPGDPSAPADRQQEGYRKLGSME